MSRSLANAVYLTKHDGNGDNRFAIIIQGSSGDSGNSFEQWQFPGNVREMARILTEHPNNTKPGPGYTGYYLQDHICYAGTENDIPEVDLDYKIKRSSKTTSYKTWIEKYTFNKVATMADSYDNVILYYTSHGGYIGSTYLFDANDHHVGSTMRQKYSISGDICWTELDNYLDRITCSKLFIILQPCYSGNWINPLKNENNEKNRVIITSEQSGKVSSFDKCNMDKGWLFSGGSPKNYQDVYYVGYDSTNKKDYPDNHWPLIDGEEYEKNAGESEKKYKAKYYTDLLIGIDTVTSGDFTLKFYENWEDNGSEFGSGLIESYIIDRFSGSTVQSNDRLDADEDTENGYNGYTHKSTIDGNENDYISCKEAFDYMELWHLGIRLNKAPWIDTPQIKYTHLEIGNNYLF